MFRSQCIRQEAISNFRKDLPSSHSSYSFDHRIAGVLQLEKVYNNCWFIISLVFDCWKTWRTCSETQLNNQRSFWLSWTIAQRRHDHRECLSQNCGKQLQKHQRWVQLPTFCISGSLYVVHELLYKYKSRVNADLKLSAAEENPFIPEKLWHKRCQGSASACEGLCHWKCPLWVHSPNFSLNQAFFAWSGGFA